MTPEKKIRKPVPNEPHRRGPDMSPPAPETEDDYNTDMNIQRASDTINQRSPDEESEVKEYYGPAVPKAPMNMQRFITKSRERQARAAEPKVQSDPPYRNEQRYLGPEPGIEPDGGGRATDSAPTVTKTPRWRQHMQKRGD